MKKPEIITKAGAAVSKMAFRTRKHSPELLIITGVIGVVAGTVMACRATTKAGKIVDKAKEDLDVVRKLSKEGSPIEEEYTEEDRRKDTAIIYANAAKDLVVLYAPAAAVSALSIAAILTSNRISRKRIAGLSAAYATLDQGFRDYRKRAVERFGEDVDKELRYGIKAEKITKTVIGEDGKEREVEDTALIVGPSGASVYARFFEKYTTDEEGNSILNLNWDENQEYNLMFIKAQETAANNLLKAKKMLFLNEVYDMLGLSRTKAGQIVGWVYDPDHPVGDNYVDFGLYRDSLSFEDDRGQAILLDFNVDGNVWELMK